MSYYHMRLHKGAETKIVYLHLQVTYVHDLASKHGWRAVTNRIRATMRYSELRDIGYSEGQVYNHLGHPMPDDSSWMKPINKGAIA